MTKARNNSSLAARRSLAYGFFAAIFEYPEGELTTLIRDGRIALQARELLAATHPQLEVDAAALSDAGVADDLAIEYTRLFDVVSGAGGALCSLYGADYDDGARLRLLEELVRFYNFFGLTAEDAPAHERPDHLSAELDFMHFLCFQEAQCADDDETVDDYRRAQRDFLEHHLGKWAPLLRSRLQKHQSLPFYGAVGVLLERFIQREQLHVGELAEGKPAMNIAACASGLSSTCCAEAQI